MTTPYQAAQAIKAAWRPLPLAVKLYVSWLEQLRDIDDGFWPSGSQCLDGRQIIRELFKTLPAPDTDDRRAAWLELEKMVLA